MGKVLAQWRAESGQRSGRAAVCFQQQAVIVDLAVKTYLILESLDNWLLQQNKLINTRNKSVYPV